LIKIKAYKHFANKLWNISRFIFDNSDTEDVNTELNSADSVLWNELLEIEKDVTKDMEEFRLYLAGEKLYQYGWTRLADEILEESKKIFADAGVEGASDEAVSNAHSRRALLRLILSDLLKLLHPFMPFVTEEIWQSMPEHKEMLMITSWPV
jgi:valyl-tRNA synthetase